MAVRTTSGGEPKTPRTSSTAQSGRARDARHGITAEEWLAQLESQDWCCPICDKTGAEVKWNIDHEHVRGWEKMKAKDKKRYWRGILCAYDNYRRVHSSNSADVTRRILHYLEAYEARKGKV
jgi:hypothetical protein